MSLFVEVKLARYKYFLLRDPAESKNTNIHLPCQKLAKKRSYVVLLRKPLIFLYYQLR
jgi:hypothetical protein